jgi:hypothetical protein
MSIIVPHLLRPPIRHTKLPYLWRIGCSCGWYALAPNEQLARTAFSSHQFEEEPFAAEEIFDTEKDHPHERKD